MIIRKKEKLTAILRRLRKKGKKIAFTNGCFDIIHPGHIKILKEAKMKADVLFVGLNSTESVRKIKPGRPFNSFSARAAVLDAVKYVDFVVEFKEKTPFNLIKKIRPDVLVKGSDWQKENVAGSRFVERYGGRVCLIPLKKGFSTTAIVKKIRKVLLGVIFFFLINQSYADFVALTFDDGPRPYYTDRLLKILDAYDVKATFFLVGSQVEKYPDLVKKISLAGHEIGNHAYVDRRLIYIGEDEVRREVLKTADLIEKACGRRPVYFRPPGGRFYFETLENIIGHEVVLWTINTNDLEVSADRVFSCATNAKDGDIILMHTGSFSTIKALPEILENFRKKEIFPVTISGLKKAKSSEFFTQGE